MSAVSRPFENWKSMLLDGRIDFRHLRRFARMLAALHAGGMRLRDKLPKELFDLTYFWNLRLEPYYRSTGERIPSAQSFYNELAESCAESRITVVHGDYSPKNILVRRNRLILLDHEVIHFGDPAFDLGFSLTHLLSKAHHLSEHRTLLLAAAQTYWKEYRRRLGPSALREFGPSFEQRVVDHTMGCLLARAAGRSQLEYLDDTAKARQTDAVLELLARRPRSVGELVARFGTRIGETQ
jgi:aminoglycoside phosphotransferase (APT) family kinase protein